MRRSVLCFSGAFGAGILTAYVIDADITVLIVFATVTLIIAVCSFLYELLFKIKKSALILCFFALGGSWFGVNEIQIDSQAPEIGKSVELQGVVTEIETDDDSCRIIIKRESEKVMIKYYGDNTYLRNCKGKSLEVCGIAEEPQGRRNPGCFDYSLYLRSCGIRTIVKGESVRIINGKEIPYLKMSGYVYNTFKERLELYADESCRGLILAILFGDKTMMDEEVYSDFQKNGTAHVLAVSGLHTGIIYAFIVFLWKWKKGSLFYITVSSFLLFYMSLADFSPSVVRASFMIILHMMAGIFRYRYDLLTSAGITFTVMLFNNPYQLFNTGFQLSFIAIASLAVIIPFVKRYYQGIFLSAIAIQAGMVPYTAYVFNYISAGSIVANIPVIFIAGVMLPVGIIALLTMAVPGELFGLLIKMMEVCGDVLVMINDFFYASGRTSFDVVSPPIWLLITYYGILFFVLSEGGQLMLIRRNLKRITAVAAGICLTVIMSIYVMSEPFDKANIVFVDVGQGDCIHIKTDAGKNYLIDGGGDADYDVGRKILKPYLLKNGVSRIDAAFVTHLHEDHYGGIKALADEGMIGMTGVFESNRYIEMDIDSELFYLHRGYSINLGDDIFLEVISPEAESEEIYKKMNENEEDENKTSLIIKVRYKGKTLLVTGDIDEEGETGLVNKYGSELSCDVMKVPHHGSKYSSSEDFVEIADPVLAVFQVGHNNYGHPSGDAISRYTERGCRIVRNDQDGAIGLIIDKDKPLEVITMCN